jgi:hypothetical protein
MLMDLALYSESMVSYEEIKRMAPLELSRLQLRLERYYKDKARAAGSKKEFL